MASKKELTEQLKVLEDDYQELVRSYDKKCQEISQTQATAKTSRALTFSLDLWPLKDWFRISISPFKPGRYFQLCIGPLRVDYFDE